MGGIFDRFLSSLPDPPDVQPPPSVLSLYHPGTTDHRPWRSIDWRENRQKILSELSCLSVNLEGNALRILLHGPVGAGKSSFFNSVNNALRGRMTIRALTNSASGVEKSFTLECKTYKVKKDRSGTYFPFTFTDIAGMHDGGVGIQPGDIKKLLKGHIKDGYTFNPVKTITKTDLMYNKNPMLKDKIHCLVAVLPADTVSMMNDDIFKQMREVRGKARDLGIPQVIIMTKVDEACPQVKENLKDIYTSKKIKQKMEECSAKLGVPVNCIFPVKNYHEERATNATVDILILDALRNIVNFASDYIEDKIDNE